MFDCVAGNRYKFSDVDVLCDGCMGTWYGQEFIGIPTDEYNILYGALRRKVRYVSGNPCTCNDVIWLQGPGSDLGLVVDFAKESMEAER